MKVFLLTFLFVSITAQLTPDVVLDIKLQEYHALKVVRQAKLVKVLSNFSVQIKNCSATLKAANVAPNVVTALNNLANWVDLIKTVDDYEPYVPIATCGDINLKITMIDFDALAMAWIMRSGNVNSTTLTKLNVELTTVMNLNLLVLGTRQTLVKAIIAQTAVVVKEYVAYNLILTAEIANLASLNLQLTVFKRTYCQCLNNVAWKGNTSTLEKNVQVVEDALKVEESKARNATLTALAKTKAAITAIANPNLVALQTLLTNIATMLDYAPIVWPNITSCNEFWTRVRFLRTKQLQYLQSLSAANVNQTLMLLAASKFLPATSTLAVKVAVNATMIARAQLMVYGVQLGYSAAKMWRIFLDFILFGNTLCSCNFNFGTTTTTTTGGPITTRNPTFCASQCGTFKYWNATEDITELSTYGISGGYWLDNSTWYVGYCDNSGCVNQNHCPGLLTDNSTEPGCYTTCGGQTYHKPGHGIYYLLNHPDLEWVQTNKTHMLTLPNTVKVKGGNHLFFFGRYTEGNTTYPAKVHTGDTYWGCYYNKRGEVKAGDDEFFEVLTCGGLITTTTTQATTTTV